MVEHWPLSRPDSFTLLGHAILHSLQHCLEISSAILSLSLAITHTFAIMGGDSDSQQPYIYEPQNRRVAYPYSDFNPKAVTHASYQKLQNNSPTKQKQDGPLINFNQHPDSYMIVPGSTMNYKPMAANTKKKVTAIRWTQFGLRITEEIGALGMLVAVICVKGMVTSMAWITRIAVGCGFTRS